MNIRYYLNESRRRVARYAFNKVIPQILNTKALEFKEGEHPVILSMVQHKDVLPYLLAVKSFAKYMPLSGVVVVADPSMTESDLSLLRTHIPGIDIRPASDFRHPHLPVGGTWERLHAIMQYSQKNYVIQLDADTVTFGDISHVQHCVQAQIPFTLGTYDLQAPVPVSEVARWAQAYLQSHDNQHIQLICESKLITAAGNTQKKYIRGCSGFTGWPKGYAHAGDLIELSRRMDAELGERWKQWGTEQFASNYMISMGNNAIALPHPVYSTPEKADQSTTFIHFIGPLRYYKALYTQKLQAFLNASS